MHTDRDLVKKGTGDHKYSTQKRGRNPLATKSLALPKSSADKQSLASTIGLGAIKLDFRKSSSGGGFMQMLKGAGGSSNKIDSEARRSQDLAQKNSGSSGGKLSALYSAVEMTKQNSGNKIAPHSKH